jgi:hypothetical protein
MLSIAFEKGIVRFDSQFTAVMQDNLNRELPHFRLVFSQTTARMRAIVNVNVCTNRDDRMAKGRSCARLERY